MTTKNDKEDTVRQDIRLGKLPAAIPVPWYEKPNRWACNLCCKYIPAEHVAAHLRSSHDISASLAPMKPHATCRMGLFATAEKK